MPKKQGQSNKDVADVLIQKKPEIKCKNKPQKEFIKLIKDKEITICSGPAGTAKSFLSIGTALELLYSKNNPYQKIIITKPAVEAEEKIGWLPGSIETKLDPYMVSCVDIIDKIIGRESRIKLITEGIIEIAALAYMRGRTIDNSILIIDEAQNTTPSQIKLMLTRIGENSKFIINGDLEQSDKYKDRTKSGLYDALSRLKEIEEIGFFEFKSEDIVRNPLIGKILSKYEN